MLNIVIPMAGRGSRFRDRGYKLPKPLIEIHGKPMIQYVIGNISPSRSHRFIFICLDEHLKMFGLSEKLKSYCGDCVIIPIESITEGAACTVLLSEDYINNDDSLMIANSDQYVDIDINNYLSLGDSGNIDGFIMTMKANDKKWSYIKYNNKGFIEEVREKDVISDQATVGIYNFTKGSDFVKYANNMISSDLRVNGEFYVAPVYNEMIKEGKKIIYQDIGSVNNGMYGLGVPEDLENFKSLDLSKKISDVL